MPLPKRPYVATFDQVRITREGDAAIIEDADSNVATTHFTLGAERMGKMTDEKILEVWNDGLEAREEMARQYEHVAVEVPLG